MPSATRQARQKRIAHRVEKDLIGQAGLAHYFIRVVDMELQCRELGELPRAREKQRVSYRFFLFYFRKNQGVGPRNR